MKLRPLIFSFLASILLVGLAGGVQPLPAAAHTAVVNAVLFYSPTCGHCNIVMDEVLPPLQAQYTDHLSVAKIDVTQTEGQNMYQAALSSFKVSSDRVGVPTLILGSAVLVGSAEIPAQLPGLIEQGLATGGVDWPDLPGLRQLVSDVDPQQGGPTVWDRVLSDPLGNSIAILVLIGMIISLLAVGYLFLQDTAGVANRWPNWAVPLFAVLGIGVASYMSYVEISGAEAVCGPVGNCNAVQTSSYARLFGVFPVGVFGIIGWAALLAAWLVYRFGPERLRRAAALAVWGMAVFGVLFASYLTFLEPFVIGATCVWCISTAILMTLTLWASTPLARLAMQIQEDDLLAEEEAI